MKVKLTLKQRILKEMVIYPDSEDYFIIDFMKTYPEWKNYEEEIRQKYRKYKSTYKKIMRVERK
jgi:hypothetical protein